MARALAFTFAFLLLACAANAALAQDANAARAEIRATYGFVPGYLNAFPDVALPGAWEEYKGLMLSSSTALPPKLKQTIALAVAAQVPCRECVYAHRKFAKQYGATDAELDLAIVMAALTRHWSTVFHGLQVDLARFKRELETTTAHAKQAINTAPANPPAAVAVTDAASARADISQSFGVLPEFMQRFPDEAIAGAWKEERDVEMSATTVLSGKHKSLISLAVASQIPCRFCVLADTEFAKLAGATEREIAEAIAVAAVTRHFSTYLSGIDLDEKEFRKDIDRMVGSNGGIAAAPAPTAAPRKKRARHP